MTKIGNGVLWVAEWHCYYDPLRFCPPLLRFVRENKFHRGFTHLGTCCFLRDNMGVGHIRVVHTRQWTAYISPRMNDWNLFDRDEIWTVHYQAWTARMMPKTHVGSPFHMGVLFYTVEAFTFLFKPSLKRPTIDGLNNTKTVFKKNKNKDWTPPSLPKTHWCVWWARNELSPSAVWWNPLFDPSNLSHFAFLCPLFHPLSMAGSHVLWHFDVICFSIFVHHPFLLMQYFGFGDFAIHFPFFVWKISHIDGKIVFI